MNHSRQFRVLAEGVTYQIVDLGFIVSCLFDLSTKNQNHTSMLKNFVLKMATEVRCNNYATKPLVSKLDKEDRKTALAQDEIGFAIYDEYTRRLESQMKSGADLIKIEAELSRPIDVYKHCGLAIRKDQNVNPAMSNSINRYPTARENRGPAEDSAFMKTMDKQSIKRHSKAHKEKIKSVYQKCYPEPSHNRSKTTESKRIQETQKGRRPSESMDEEQRLSLALDFEKAPQSLNGVKEAPRETAKVYSYKVHSFVEREYVRRTTLHLKRAEEEKQKQAKRKPKESTNSNSHIHSSHNSSRERSDVVQLNAGVEVHRLPDSLCRGRTHQGQVPDAREPEQLREHRREGSDGPAPAVGCCLASHQAHEPPHQTPARRRQMGRAPSSLQAAQVGPGRATAAHQ